MTQLYEWRGNECESEVQAALHHASPSAAHVHPPRLAPGRRAAPPAGLVRMQPLRLSIVTQDSYDA